MAYAREPMDAAVDTIVVDAEETRSVTAFTALSDISQAFFFVDANESETTLEKSGAKEDDVFCAFSILLFLALFLPYCNSNENTIVSSSSSSLSPTPDISPSRVPSDALLSDSEPAVSACGNHGVLLDASNVLHAIMSKARISKRIEGIF